VKSRAPIFGLLAALLIGVAYWFLLYQPQSEEQELIEAETETLLAEQQTLRNDITRLREVEANQVQITAQLARLEEYIPSSAAQPAFIRQLQISADASGLGITSVGFGSPAPIEGAPPTGEPDTALASVPVTVTVSGGYFQAVDLFRRLETEVTRAVLLSNLSFVEGEDEYPQLSTTWAGDLFAVVPVTAAPPPEAPAEGTDTEGADVAAPTEVQS
jgi:Tfp pilus assembly protein PilO